MTRQQQYAINAFRAGGAYYRPGLGIELTSEIGAGVMTAGKLVAMVPGGQLPGAIIGAVGALTSLIGGLFKPDLTKIEATHIVDQVEAQVLKPTLSSWQALPAAQKTVSMQTAYLATVDSALNNVRQGCSNPQLGTAGQNCISERLIHGGTAPWCPTGTGCDWITLYRDPIANDPEVHPDPAVLAPGSPVSSAVSSFFGGSPTGETAQLPMKLLLGGALILVALAFD